MPKKLMRYLIPADEPEIVLPLTGEIRFVNHTADGVIECFVEEVEGGTTIYTVVRVVDTGKTVPDYYSYLGSAVVGRNVRHVYAAVPDDDATSWGVTPESALAEEYGAQSWTPASTNDVDAENATSWDSLNYQQSTETDPGASR
jgi:hypothetical protein